MKREKEMERKREREMERETDRQRDMAVSAREDRVLCLGDFIPFLCICDDIFIMHP